MCSLTFCGREISARLPNMSSPQPDPVLSNEILSIEDVIQIEGRGTVVIGIKGSGWGSAKVGDAIELQPLGRPSIKTSIKDKEVSRKDGHPGSGAILLADTI